MQQQLQSDSLDYLLFTGVTFVAVGAAQRNFFKMGLFNLAASVAHQEVPGVVLDPEDWGMPQNTQWQLIWRNEQREQSLLLRDIFGNPFRPVTFDPRWRTSTVADLAQVIYDERAFDRMPYLADALMDAGCDSDEIIMHCRGPGPHVKGCWVVDLILGKE